MGKRSDFERVERDYYKTPLDPVLALSPYLNDVRSYIEPCCGDGTLVRHLENLGHQCAVASDIEPQLPWQAHHVLPFKCDLFNIAEIVPSISHFITNPPWPARFKFGEPTLSIIRHLSAIRPTWLLLSGDFMHNVYASEVLAYCAMIVSVGRVQWIEGSENTGKDNVAWYLFDQTKPIYYTSFYPRKPLSATYSADIEELIG